MVHDPTSRSYRVIALMGDFGSEETDHQLGSWPLDCAIAAIRSQSYATRTLLAWLVSGGCVPLNFPTSAHNSCSVMAGPSR